MPVKKQYYLTYKEAETSLNNLKKEYGADVYMSNFWCKKVDISQSTIEPIYGYEVGVDYAPLD